MVVLTYARLDEFLDRCAGMSIALVGDLFLDRYLEVEPGVEERSIETGLEAFQVTRVRNSPGALGTVINNLAALGVARLIPVTVVGCDGHADDLLRTLDELPVDQSLIVRRPERLTPTYTKPLKRSADGVWRELNRLDIRTRGPLTREAAEQVIANVSTALDAADGVILLDQVNETDWGVINQTVRGELAARVGQHPEKLFFSDSRNHVGEFQFGVVKGNRDEFTRAAGVPADQLDRYLSSVATRNGREVYCTCGAEGICIASPNGSLRQVAGIPVTGPIDIVGAGDAATSGIVTGLLAGGSPREAAAVGNLVASITIQQLGTTGTATPDQLRARLTEFTSRN